MIKITDKTRNKCRLWNNAWWYKDWTRWLCHGSFGRSCHFQHFLWQFSARWLQLKQIQRHHLSRPEKVIPDAMLCLPHVSPAHGQTANTLPELAKQQLSFWGIQRPLDTRVLLVHSGSQSVGWRVAFGWPKHCPLSQKAPKRRNCEIFECTRPTEYHCQLQLHREEKAVTRKPVSVHPLQRWKLPRQKLLVNEVQKAVDRCKRISTVIWHPTIIWEIFSQHEQTDFYFISRSKAEWNDSTATYPQLSQKLSSRKKDQSEWQKQRLSLQSNVVVLFGFWGFS